MDYIASTTPKARKEHCCDGCLRPIKVHHRYHRIIHVNDGTLQTTKLCYGCSEFIGKSKYSDEWAEFNDGDVGEARRDTVKYRRRKL